MEWGIGRKDGMGYWKKNGMGSGSPVWHVCFYFMLHCTHIAGRPGHKAERSGH